MLRAFLGLHGIAHLAGTSDLFTKAADGEPVDHLAGAWTLSDPAQLRAVGLVIDVALLALAVRSGGVSRAGARR